MEVSYDQICRLVDEITKLRLSVEKNNVSLVAIADTCMKLHHFWSPSKSVVASTKPICRQKKRTTKSYEANIGKRMGLWPPRLASQ